MQTSELKGEELRIAVAVKLGFMLSPDGKNGVWKDANGGSLMMYNHRVKDLPGYDWDLNATAEMERVYVVPKKLGQIYDGLLDEECGDEHGTYHASATERCRAFLRLP